MRKIQLLLALLAAAILLLGGGPGFRSRKQLDEHFQKHGHEFGEITKQQYLAMAQELRDAPAGADILEATRSDGGFSRFHRKKGWFGAYNSDRTIRTFFIPVEGERYFQRQGKRYR